MTKEKRNWPRELNYSTFFFTEFSNIYETKELYIIVKEYSVIEEVVILPPRRDQCGKRFGFTRFRKMVDERLMATKLDNIIIGSRKIRANISKFQRRFPEWRYQDDREDNKKKGIEDGGFRNKQIEEGHNSKIRKLPIMGGQQHGR